MKSLRANVTPSSLVEPRQSRRWEVDLLVAMTSDQTSSSARIRNLSEGGMMLDTDADLAVGDNLAVRLDGVLDVEATVIWCHGQTFGCRFATPLLTAQVSAAILQAPGDGNTVAPNFQEFAIGVRPTVDEIAAWKSDFEKTHGAAGLRLVAFRQAEGGMMVAIAASD